MSNASNATIHLVAAAMILAAGSVSARAGDIPTVSHGDRIELGDHLVPGKLNLVDFYADWCGPCRAIAPKIERLAEANPDTLAVWKVDIIDWDSPVTGQFRLRSIPHLKLFDEQGALIAEGNAGAVLAAVNRRLGPSAGSSAAAGETDFPVGLLVILAGIGALAAVLIRRSGGSGTSAPIPSPAGQGGRLPPNGWFVMLDQSLEGPFSEADLEDMVRRKIVSPESKARRHGQGSWTSIRDVIDHLR